MLSNQPPQYSFVFVKACELSERSDIQATVIIDIVSWMKIYMRTKPQE